MKLKYRRQRPIQGGRESLPACVIKDIKYQVEYLSKKYRVSKSFVIAATLADAFGIDRDVQERFVDESIKRRMA